MFRAKLLYFASATAHSRVTAVASGTIFLGVSLQLAAFSFVYSKAFSCSECFISGSCKCSRGAKSLSSIVVEMASHCLLSHLRVSNSSLLRNRQYK